MARCGIAAVVVEAPTFSPASAPGRPEGSGEHRLLEAQDDGGLPFAHGAMGILPSASDVPPKGPSVSSVSSGWMWKDVD